MLRQDPRAVEALRAPDDRVASEVTRFEVLAGAHDDELEATELLLAQLQWVPVDEPISRLAAGLARELRGGFSGIEDADYLIAATALELGAELLTTNVRHFPMFEGLQPAY